MVFCQEAICFMSRLFAKVITNTPLIQTSNLSPPYLSPPRSILDDVRWLLGDSVHPQDPADPKTLDPWFGPVRHASDYFHTIHEAAVYLIKEGLAYVDDLTPGGQQVSFV